MSDRNSYVSKLLTINIGRREYVSVNELVAVVARVAGKGGGGGGSGPAQDGQTRLGRGGGFGLSTKPAGVFVVKDGKVSWRPSVDVNKVIMGGQILAGITVLAVRSILRSRRR